MRQRLSNQEIIKPAPLEKWDAYESSATLDMVDKAQSVRSLLYPETEDNVNSLDKIFDLNGDQARANKLALGFLLYSSSYDFDIVKLAGLGYEMSYEPGYSYRFEISNAGSKPTIVYIDPSTYQSPMIPEVVAEWGNRHTKLRWNASKSQGDFLGYLVSKSDNGTTYLPVNQKLHMSNLGLLPDSSELLKMEFKDSLSTNENTYWYKIEGFDFFGKVSVDHQIIWGSGYESIGISPIVEYANQTDANEAHIKWSLPDNEYRLVKWFRVLHSDRDNGPFEIIRDSIDVAVHEIEIPMTSTQNHYLIEAVPHRGRPVSSMPVFIMGQDTLPPSVPEELSAVLDSAGVVTLSWKSNSTPSASHDVVDHKLFRRAINTEFSWTLIAILDSTDYDLPYFDTNLEINIPYAYTLVAFDDAGLESEPVKPRNFTLKKEEEEFDPITRVTQSYNDKLKEVTLGWDLKEMELVEHIYLYRGPNAQKLGKYKILEGSVKSFVDKATNGDKVFYKIKPVYANQTQNYFSDTIEVQFSKSD